MWDEEVENLKIQLIQAGYSIEPAPILAGSRSLLYAKSNQLTSVGPIKFYNHTLFMDWDDDLFSQVERLKPMMKAFSDLVNRDYKVPRAWRIKIPNLTLVVMSRHEFAPEAAQLVENNYFIPFVGGEVGQIILLDYGQRSMINHYPVTYKQTGSIPLGYALREIRHMTQFKPLGRDF